MPETRPPHVLLIFAGLVALYWLTAPRTVVLEDDGLLTRMIHFLGVVVPWDWPR